MKIPHAIGHWFIYTLSDPFTLEVRYVGFTSRPSIRLSAHISESRRPGVNTHKSCWIRSLLRNGSVPIMSIIQSGTSRGWEQAERKWIKHYRDIGYSLTNMSNGGHGARLPRTVDAKLDKRISRIRIRLAEAARKLISARERSVDEESVMCGLLLCLSENCSRGAMSRLAIKSKIPLQQLSDIRHRRRGVGDSTARKIAGLK